MDLRITSHRLANGLRVVLVSDPRAAEVQVTMRYGVGAADEPAGQGGIAHLVEHLMFQQVIGAQSVFAKLEALTTFFNASTTFDATTFVARAQPTHLDALLSIEAVRLGLRCTSITESAFVREREVVLNEGRQKSHTAALWSALHGGVFPPDHPYVRAAADERATLAAITREQACAFADAYYAPANAVLVVSGNVTTPQVEAGLTKFFARIPARAIAVRPPVGGLPAATGDVEIAAPLDGETLIVTWPLPADPRTLAEVRAAAKIAHAVIDNSVRGRVDLAVLGDERARVLAISIVLEEGEQRVDVIAAVRAAVDRIPFAMRQRETPLDRIAFNTVQQGAIYELFATLEEGSDRDARLAAHVLAGRDPAAALATEAQALRAMTRAETARIAERHLAGAQARVVVLTPTKGTLRAEELTLAAPVHDLGQRRDVGDLADAHRPVNLGAPPRGVDAMITRTLPNGLDVVLLPLASVPTVDVRLIFGSGTGDEPRDRRGAALLAAYGLQWRVRHVNDLLLFAAAGGSDLVEVEHDHTTFIARGLDMHLDYLLAGMRRWIRDGHYTGFTASMLDAVRHLIKQSIDDGAVTDALRAALYGADHPYVQAGLRRHIADALTIEDVTRFRATHFTPGNGTLVIAGRFDAALANRWIDHLFGDWQGAAPPARAAPVSSSPIALADDEDGAFVHLQAALPATASTRAHRLVAAAMLDELAADVRHQLGASYGVTARLTELRHGAFYQLAGAIDATRATEAISLLQTRLEALRGDPGAAARAFVGARRRVVTRLLALTGSAAGLADRVQTDVTLARAPLSDVATAQEVQALTLASVAPTLAELDLSRAVVLLRGPAAELDRAFASLGRTPTRVARAAAKPAGAAVTPTARPDAEVVRWSDLEDPLTLQGPPTRLTLSLLLGYSTGRVLAAHDVSGGTLAAEAGYRLSLTTAIGARASFGRLRDRYEAPTATLELRDVEVVPVTLAGFVQARAYDRLWGATFVGLQLDRITDHDLPSTWHRGVGIGLEGGIDVLAGVGHRLAVFGRLDSVLLSDSAYTAFTLGIGYRY